MKSLWFFFLNISFLCCNAAASGKRGGPVASALISENRKCRYIRTHGMLGVDCQELHLRSVPSTLTRNVQILDLTFNRIRELHNTTFTNYPSLQILYLNDNSISYIEAGAFQAVSYLEVIDLTLNSLHEVPDAINYLPSLRKLILSENPFVTVNFFEPLPSVEYLELSGCKLKTLPDLKVFPRLSNLNVSNNLIKSVSVHQIAPLCRLQELDLTNNTRMFRFEYCNCQLLQSWSLKQGIRIIPQSSKLCANKYDSDVLITNTSECFNNETESILEASMFVAKSCEFEVQRYGSGPSRLFPASLSTWALIGLIVVLAILVLSFSVYCARRRHNTPNNTRRRGDNSQEQLTDVKTRS